MNRHISVEKRLFNTWILFKTLIDSLLSADNCSMIVNDQSSTSISLFLFKNIGHVNAIGNNYLHHLFKMKFNLKCIILLFLLFVQYYRLEFSWLDRTTWGFNYIRFRIIYTSKALAFIIQWVNGRVQIVIDSANPWNSLWFFFFS
jgi:hypothetical protein